MSRNLSVVILVLSAAFVVLPASGAEQFTPSPLPDLVEEGYTWEEVQLPHSDSIWMDLVDTFVLIAALAAATFLVIRRRSRRGLLFLSIFSVIYFGFIREGCICPIGSIQNVALAVFGDGYALPVMVASFFALPLLMSLLFGRVFCSSVCPLGAIQDLVAFQPIKLPTWLKESLSLLPWLVLALGVSLAATGTMFPLCRYDPFVGFFRFGGPWKMIVAGGCFLVLGIYVARPYCRFLCPYGALLRLPSRITRYHVTIAPTECITCRLCENSCPFGAIAIPSEQHGGPRRSGLRRLVILILLLPVLLAAGIVSGRLLSDPVAGLHPVTSVEKQLRLEEESKAEGREITYTDESEAWRGRAATALFNRRIDQIILEWEKGETPRNLPKSNRERKLLSDFLESKKRDRAALRAALLTTSAESLTEHIGLSVTLAFAFFSLVIWLKLISLNVRRTRTIYEPDRAMCFSCGRCIDACPLEQERKKGGEK